MLNKNTLQRQLPKKWCNLIEAFYKGIFVAMDQNLIGFLTPFWPRPIRFWRGRQTLPGGNDPKSYLLFNSHF